MDRLKGDECYLFNVRNAFQVCPKYLDGGCRLTNQMCSNIELYKEHMNQLRENLKRRII